jgi:hypothetical protein
VQLEQLAREPGGQALKRAFRGVGITETDPLRVCGNHGQQETGSSLDQRPKVEQRKHQAASLGCGDAV